MIGWIERKIRGDVDTTIPYTDPLHAGRHPFQTFILSLCIVSSVPLVFGYVTAGSIEDSLPWWGALTWGMSLLFGSVLGLVGSFWRGDYDTALTMERIGLNLAGFAAVIYGFIIPLVGGWNGLIAAAVVLGFGASCLTRARDIARIFARATEQGSPRVKEEGE